MTTFTRRALVQGTGTLAATGILAGSGLTEWARANRYFASDDDVFFLPGKIVMILQIKQHLCAKVFSDVPVNARVVCRRVLPHQFHGFPILLAFLRNERQPRQTQQLAR